MNEPSNFCPGDVCWLPAAPPPPPATRNGSSGLRAGHPSAQPLHEQQEQQERQQQMQMQQRQQQQEQRRRQQMRADAVVAGSPGSPRTKTVGELRHSLRGGQVRQGATAAIQQQVRQGAAAAAATAATARVAGGAAGGDLGGDPAATAEATIALRAAPKGRRTAIGTAAVGNPAGDFAATTPKPATTEMDTGAGTAAAAGAAGAGAVNSVGVRPRGRAAERRAHAAQNCEIQCKQAECVTGSTRLVWCGAVAVAAGLHSGIQSIAGRPAACWQRACFALCPHAVLLSCAFSFVAIFLAAAAAA